MVEPYFEGDGLSKGVRTFMAMIYPFLLCIWVYFGVAKLPPGYARIIAVVPIVLLNVFAPLSCTPELFDQPHPNFSYVGVVGLAVFFTWFANLKVIAFALNRGVLSDIVHWGLWKFSGVLLLPVNPKVTPKDEADLSKSPEIDFSISCRLMVIARLTGQFFLKYGLFLLFSWIIGFTSPGRWVLAITYFSALYLILGLLMDSSQLLATLLFGIPTHNSFVHPYVSRDLKDLWGKRWNVTTAVIFRAVSYDIVMDGCLVKPDKSTKKKRRSEFVKSLATLSIFGLSAIVHGGFFWYITGLLSWVWTLFYFSFAPVLLLEQRVKSIFVKHDEKCKDDGMTLLNACQWLLGIAYTLTTVWVAFVFLFAPPVEEAGVHKAAIAVIETHFGKQE